MATDTTTTFVDYLKDIYGTSVQNGIREDSPYYDLIKTADKTFLGGTGFKVPVRLGRGGNAGSVAEDGILPTAAVPTSDRIEVGPTELWARFNLTKRLIQAAKGDKATFADAFAERAEQTMMELQEQLNRQLIGNKIATAGGHTTTVTGALGRSTTASTTVVLTTDTAMQFRRGMKVLLGTGTEFLAGTGDASVVTDITAKNTVVLSVAAAIDDIIAVGDSAVLATGWNSYGDELQGLAFAVDNADTFQTINPADTGKAAWKATKDSAAVDRPLQKSHITGSYMAVKVKSGKHANCIVTHDLGLIEMQKLMESDVRYVPQTFKGGFEHELFAWNNGKKNCPVVPESCVEVGSFYFLNLDDIRMGYIMDWGWLDDDGSKASRVLNRASFEHAYGCMFQQLFLARNSHLLLRDIIVDDSSFAAPD